MSKPRSRGQPKKRRDLEPTARSSTHARTSDSGALRLAVLFLYTGSGCAALIYEIVWFDRLQLVIGSTAVSLGVLLATFMGGTCLGSLAAPRLIPSRQHPLVSYAMLEAGAGILGIAVLFALPVAGRLYIAGVEHGLPGFLVRGAISAACLLPSTLLMGATLPVLGRFVESSPRGVSWLGLFYAANIAGAVFGCLFAGFYLLRIHDAETATYAAAAINGMAAAISLIIAGRTAYHAGPEPTERPSRESAAAAVSTRRRFLEVRPDELPVYLAVAVSGACALSAEVIWTRILSLMLGATVYTFSVVLAVFLGALGLGTWMGSLVAGRTSKPRLALGVCQLLLSAAIAWAAFMLSNVLPYWPLNPTLSTSPSLAFQLDVARCLWVVPPAAVLWGASFPLALAAAALPGRGLDRVVGGLYAANTLGALVGSIATSLWVIPRWGSQDAQRALIGMSAIAGLALIAPLARRTFHADAGAGQGSDRALRIPFAGVLMAGSAGLAAWLMISIPPIPGMLVAYGRQMASWIGHVEVIYAGEGINASVAVSQFPDGVRNFHVSGKVEASSQRQDMRLQRMLAHLPALIHAKPRSVLVAGLGAGVTAGSFVPYHDITRIAIVEIEPLIPTVVASYFERENDNVLRDPRVRVTYDDARHYLLTTSDRFDIVTSDPIHPWVKGSATLYTKEYFELVRQHLNPGGIVTQWVPLYETDVDAVKMEIATFFEVFPRGTIWGNARDARGIDIVLMGQRDPGRIDVDEIERRLAEPGLAEVAASLRGVGFRSAVDLLATFTGWEPDLRQWLNGSEINSDRTLRLQYLAGMELNSYRSAGIYQELLTYRRFSDELFAASASAKEALWNALVQTLDGRAPPS